MVKSKPRELAGCVGHWVRWIVFSLAAATLLGVAWLVYSERENTLDVPFPTQAQLRSSRDRAAAWIVRNRGSVLNENNSMLWLFVRDAGRLSADAQLQALATEYQARSVNGTVGQFFFDSTDLSRAREASIILGDEWQGYQRLFVYGATCNVPLRSDPDVVALLNPAACESGHLWLRNPWCRTHQLMGLRFVQKNHCEPDEATASNIQGVQAGILTELRWDFRVEDAYLQKVWTLIESGRRNDIKPVWIRRILDAQQEDGGWAGADVIARLPGGRAIFWQGGLLPRVGAAQTSDFHATAQGLYLTALLLKGVDPPPRP